MQSSPGMEKLPASDQARIKVLIGHKKIRRAIVPLDFFEPLEYQKLFEQCLAKIKGVFGGNRSGKTKIGAKYVIDRCLAKPRQRWWAVAETEDLSIEVQQRKVFELLPKDQLRYCYYDDINGFRNGKVVFKNGSYLKFKTYKQGQIAFASDDLDGIWNDEEPPYEVYREQKMRLVDRDGEMIFTLTALKGVTELISEIYDDHEVIRSEYCELIQEELPRIIEKNGVRFFLLWTTENPYISQDRLKEDIKVMSRSEIKSRILGIPLNLSGRIYPMFNRQIHVVSEDMLPTRLVTLYHVLDPHDVKPWAMQWWAVDKTGAAYCIREYPWQRNFNDMDTDDKTYDDYATVIRATEAELLEIYGRSVYKRIIDPNFGNKTVQLAKRTEKGSAKTSPVKELKARGFTFVDAVDNIEPGHLQVRKRLNWDEKDGEIIVQPTGFVYELCENTTRHLSRYSQKDIYSVDGDVKANPQLTQKYKDFADLTRYFFMANPHYVERRERQAEPAERVY